MTKFGVVLGIKDSEGVKILGQEMIFSEYRFKNLVPLTVVRAVNRKRKLEKPDNSGDLIISKTRECDIYRLQRELFTIALIWNSILSRWELWKDNGNLWNITTGEPLKKWIAEQFKIEK